jgi:flagellar biosynthesis protein FlhB
MKKFKTQTFFKHLVLIFSIAYLLGSFANMLLIPRYTASYNPIVITTGVVSNELIKCVNFHKINFLQIFDRSMFENDQLVNTLRCIPKVFVLIFIGLGLLCKKSALIYPRSILFYNHQYAYLSFCTFRI